MYVCVLQTVVCRRTPTAWVTLGWCHCVCRQLWNWKVRTVSAWWAPTVSINCPIRWCLMIAHRWAEIATLTPKDFLEVSTSIYLSFLTFGSHHVADGQLLTLDKF